MGRGREQKSARYWRLRFADDTAQRFAEFENDAVEDAWDYDYDHRDVEFDARQIALEQTIAELWVCIRSAAPFNGLPLDVRPVECSVPVHRERPIEVRLIEHIDRITTSLPLDWLDEQAAAGLRELEVLADHHHRGELAPVLGLALFQPFWLRSPSSWRPTENSLLEHLLFAYPAPRFLHSVAASLGTLAELRAMSYLVTLAQGGSLRRLTELANRRWPQEWAVIPHKLVACLGRVNERLSPRNGLMEAEVLRLGGSEVEFQRLHRVVSFNLDPSSNEDPDWLEFWRLTVGWLVRHRDELDDESAISILHWARHMHIEYRRAGQCFSWRGRAVASTLREATAYRQSWYQPRTRTLSWRHHGLDWADHEWSICELTTSAELQEESRAMSHCVSGYDHGCFHGRIAIFSLRNAGRRCVTIELLLANKAVIQAKRAYNQDPSSLELAVIERWSAFVASANNQKICSAGVSAIATLGEPCTASP